MLVRHRVKDFEAWKPTYENETMGRAGVISEPEIWFINGA